MLQIVLLTILVALLGGTFLWYRVIWSYRLDSLPGPTMWPLIGQILSHLELTEAHDLFAHIQKLQKKYGSIMLLWNIRMTPHINIADVNVVEYILSSSKHIKKAHDYDLIMPWLGEGLLTSTGSKWHKRRKILTPAFHFKILEEFTDTINKNGNILLKKLAKLVDTEVDIYPYINLYALDVICETAMGTSINAQHNEHTEYLNAIRSYLGIMQKKIFSVWKQFPTLFKLFSTDRKKELQDLSVLHKFTKSVIEKRREELLQNVETNTKQKRKLAFLDLLLQTTQDGQPLSNEDIREEVDTFMFEGNDTVSSALSFLLYEITKHDDIKQKIMEELDDIFGDKIDKQPTISDLQKLNYMELVIKEGLRLYPPVPIMERIMEEDVYINSDVMKGKPLFMSKGTVVIINVYALHRNEKLYPEAEKFIPERFVKENMLDKSPFAYIPFSAGSRNCIGQKFAMLEMKATLVKIFANFTLHPAISHVPQIFSDSVMKSRNGLPIRFVKRI